MPPFVFIGGRQGAAGPYRSAAAERALVPGTWHSRAHSPSVRKFFSNQISITVSLKKYLALNYESERGGGCQEQQHAARGSAQPLDSFVKW